MKIKPPQVIIDEQDPFLNDLLHRKPFAKKLTNIILANKDELVIALNGQWGEGKTTFIKMWQIQLENDGYPCIYIDSFKNDYTEDAFSTISLEIISFIENNLSDQSKKKEFLNKTFDVTKRLLIWSGKIGLKAITLNAIGENETNTLIEGVKEDIANDVSKKLSDFTTDELITVKKSQCLFEEYKRLLSEVAISLGSDSDKPLIIIIDELDRCTPKFSVQILEKIKHFFSVKNVVFVLSTNLEQLEHAIKSEYGIGIDANIYLQKFIDISATLPRYSMDTKGSIPSNTDYKGSVKYYSNLLKHFGFLDTVKSIENSTELVMFTMDLLSTNRTSYRQAEKIMMNTNILISSFDSKQLNYIVILLIILVSYLKTMHPNKISLLYKNELSRDGIFELCELNKFENSVYNETISDLRRYIDYCLDHNKHLNDDGFKNFYDDTMFLGGGFCNRITVLLETLDSFKIFDEKSIYNTD